MGALRIASAALALGSVLALAACGDDTETTEDDGSGAAGPTTTTGAAGSSSVSISSSTTSTGGTGGAPECTTAVECDDNDLCTTDACNANVCANDPVDPDDSDICTTDSCDPVLGVQNIAVDPNDNDACTADSCDPVLGIQNVTIDPDDSNVCTTDSCDSVMGVINTPIDPNDSNACTIDFCDPMLGVQNLPELALFSDDFSTNTQGWTLGTQWAIGAATASTGGHHGADPAQDHTPTNDNGIAGVVIGGNAPTALHGYYYLESPIINAAVMSGHVTLSYWRWLNSDYTPYMNNIVEVYNGTAWVQLWQSGGSPWVEDSPVNGNGWVHYSHDLTAHANPNLRVRFGFNIASGGVYTVGSWNLDDVEILVLPIPADNNPCTEDTCDVMTGPVYTPWTTSDGNTCTTDACETKRAIFHTPAPIPSDNNVCTTDGCDPMTGPVYTPVASGTPCGDSNVCNGDELCNGSGSCQAGTPLVCDDMQACTTDTCNATSGCVFTSNQPHDKCTDNGPNTPLFTCSATPCINQVCAAMPSCCSTDWDINCVNAVFSVCSSKACTASAGNCPHALCSEGPPVTPFTSGCDSAFGNCAAAVCAADPYCCNTDWDGLCVNQVTSVCMLNCN